MTKALRVLALIAIFAGCDDNESREGEHGVSAQLKCETLVTTFCDAVTTCAVDEDLLAEDYSPNALFHDCGEVVARSAHCRDAKAVTSKYESCLSAASDRLDCDESNESLLEEQTFAIPAACKGVVQY